MLKTIIGVLALATPIAATNATEPKTEVVRYDDLNLAHGAGQKQLDIRIRAAAKSVCGFTYSRSGPRDFASRRECYLNALASAQQQVARIDNGHTYGG